MTLTSPTVSNGASLGITHHCHSISPLATFFASFSFTAHVISYSCCQVASTALLAQRQRQARKGNGRTLCTGYDRRSMIPLLMTPALSPPTIRLTSRPVSAPPSLVRLPSEVANEQCEREKGTVLAAGSTKKGQTYRNYRALFAVGSPNGHKTPKDTSNRLFVGTPSGCLNCQASLCVLRARENTHR